jgi:hypothetical protein
MSTNPLWFELAGRFLTALNCIVTNLESPASMVAARRHVSLTVILGRIVQPDPRFDPKTALRHCDPYAVLRRLVRVARPDRFLPDGSMIRARHARNR